MAAIVFILIGAVTAILMAHPPADVLDEGKITYEDLHRHVHSVLGLEPPREAGR
jgi:hypothetical protein